MEGRADGIVEVVFADNDVVEVVKGRHSAPAEEVNAVHAGMELRVSAQQPRRTHGGIRA